MTSQLPQQAKPAVVIVEDECTGKIQTISSIKSQPPRIVIEEEETIQVGRQEVAAVQSSQTSPDTVTNTATTVHVQSYVQAKSAKSTGQHANWRTMTEKPLWIFFAKVRQINQANPDSQSVKTLYKDIKEELYNRYLPDVMKIVRSYFSRKMPKFSLLHQEDLEEAAQMSMWSYLDKFDPYFGTITFMQYLNAKGKSRLIGSILDRLRSLQDFPRDIALFRRELKPKFKALAHKLGHKPTIEEFLDEYGWDQVSKCGETYRKILSDPLFFAGVFNQRQHTSIDNEGLNEEELESLANHQAPLPSRDNRTNRADTMTFVLSHIKDDDIRYVIWEYYYNDETYKRICQSLRSFGKKCSPSWVKGKHDEGLRIIGQSLGRQGLELLARRHDE